MSVWGVTMIKDEADVIEQTLRHLHAEALDGVVVLDNQSTDGTREILEDLAEEWLGWLRIIDDPEVGYWQSAKMTSAARRAGELGATWVIPFDADELWQSPDERTLRDTIMLHGDQVNGQTALLYDHRCTGVDEGDWSSPSDDPFTRMGWRHATPIPLPKACVRVSALRSIHPGNHGAELSEQSWSEGILTVRHFPWRSPQQAVRKVTNGSRAYKATTLPRTTGQHWREMGDTLDAHGPEGVVAWFADAFYFAMPAEAGLVYDPAPIALEPSDA